MATTATTAVTLWVRQGGRLQDRTVPADLSFQNPDIRERFNNAGTPGSSYWIELRCLACGYTGPMMVTCKLQPWWAEPWLLILAAVTVIGVIGLLIWGLVAVNETKVVCLCPGCESIDTYQ